MDWEKMNFRTEKEGKEKLFSFRGFTCAGAGFILSFPHSHNHRHNHNHIHIHIYIHYHISPRLPVILQIYAQYARFMQETG